MEQKYKLTENINSQVKCKSLKIVLYCPLLILPLLLGRTVVPGREVPGLPLEEVSVVVWWLGAKGVQGAFLLFLFSPSVSSDSLSLFLLPFALVTVMVVRSPSAFVVRLAEFRADKSEVVNKLCTLVFRLIRLVYLWTIFWTS